MEAETVGLVASPGKVVVGRYWATLRSTISSDFHENMNDEDGC